MLSEKAIKLIDDKNFGVLATISKNGFPHATPIWVDRDGDYILINTTENRKKVKNVRVNPKVALAVINNQNPYEKVCIEGEVVEISYNNAEEHIDKLAKKYLGLDKYPWKRPNEKRIILKIKPIKEYS